MKTFARALTVAALAAAGSISLTGPVQASAPSQAAAPARQPVALQDDGGHAAANTSMNFEEFGKKGAYDHAREWNDDAGQ
ncbi:hypothetical protein [Streptomyces sp. NPDC059092]|uniref:hypothetical protein n=1 Tax=Streptomyces sp. NPDC059092 TaxID=3346725 RepID=UPI0036A7A7C8